MASQEGCRLHLTDFAESAFLGPCLLSLRPALSGQLFSLDRQTLLQPHLMSPHRRQPDSALSCLGEDSDFSPLWLPLSFSISSCNGFVTHLRHTLLYNCPRYSFRIPTGTWKKMKEKINSASFMLSHSAKLPRWIPSISLFCFLYPLIPSGLTPKTLHDSFNVSKTIK